MSRMVQEEITYRLVSDDDITAATTIYLLNFPNIAKKWFVNQEHARIFYHDLIDLMGSLYPETFFTAHSDGLLAGYLILTNPAKKLIPTLLSGGFFLKLIWHFISGRYGSSPAFYKKVLKELVIPKPFKPEIPLHDLPHVYIFIVEERFRGKGIGTELIQRALDFCRQSYRMIWLYVERENTDAVRFYERLGFEIFHSDVERLLMTLKLALVNSE